MHILSVYFLIYNNFNCFYNNARLIVSFEFSIFDIDVRYQ